MIIDIGLILTILLVVLVISLLFSLPVYGHSREWGYLPSSMVTILIVIVILALLL